MDPPARYECIKKASLKESPDLASPMICFIQPGQHMEVLETKAAPVTGRTRFRCRVLLEDGFPGSTGWASLESGTMSRLFTRLDDQLDDEEIIIRTNVRPARDKGSSGMCTLS